MQQSFVRCQVDVLLGSVTTLLSLPYNTYTMQTHLTLAWWSPGVILCSHIYVCVCVRCETIGKTFNSSHIPHPEEFLLHEKIVNVQAHRKCKLVYHIQVFKQQVIHLSRTIEHPSWQMSALEQLLVCYFCILLVYHCTLYYEMLTRWMQRRGGEKWSNS